MNKKLFFIGLMASVVCAEPLHVKVAKASGAWQLLVNDKPFYVKGVGCNTAMGENGEDYLRMAQEMGGNAVRTWGDAPRAYLDKAHSYGLKVNLGVWFNPIRNNTSETYIDKAHRTMLKEKALTYVREMKDHPALLMWNLGNEVFAFTESEEERKAFGLFLEDLIVAVHQEDPHHPVIYACSANRDVPDLRKHVPSLDIVGLNIYSAMIPSLGEGYDKPTLMTEFGPQGGWDVSKDSNGLPYDPSDAFKANNYVDVWRHIQADRDRALGGFAFVLGEQRNQDSLTWWNMNYGELHRASYVAMREIFTGKKSTFRIPKISAFHLEKKVVERGERMNVNASVFNPDDTPLQYEYFITDIFLDPLLVSPALHFPVEAENLSPGKARIKVPNDPGVYRVYVVVKDNRGHVAIANKSIKVL